MQNLNKLFNINKKPIFSIVILTRNGLSFTKICIESILKNTKLEYELIFIDNGSNDGTSQYLKTIGNSKLIINKENKGFAAGCNQGLKKVNGKYIVLLNNDTIVSKEWLIKMKEWLEKDPSIGIVGPRSNMVLPEQSIGPQYYQVKNQSEIEKFAEEWAEKWAHTGYKVQRLSGFCMVFRKELIEKIGGFDTRFFPGNSEDTDFCIRTRIAGKKLWVANDVFIHHFGNRTFKLHDENYERLLVENQKKLLTKWNFNSLNEIEQLIKRESPFNHFKHYIPL
ncbi:glycosyltransferase family 2 protein [Cytobacillus firmus]|uniref:glycosyltransferase family 2 protein n=1 Tax=Cytobacillus firmus TaxID=1399 RepID=UPI0021626DE4|nr:glycosyltransferase family 2 protein [Cytobacillus firmus]MCS0673865.1 glycosyltransferase family 2 protein [Cytobacillus firmus]